jgi:haloacetate dehalogenase
LSKKKHLSASFMKARSKEGENQMSTPSLPGRDRDTGNATGVNRREMIELSLAAALAATAFAGKAQGEQPAKPITAKPITLPELPPKPPKEVTAKLFPGFVETEVRTSGATIPVLHKGDGPPVLLLHGYPENRFTWHKVAPRLAERFSVYIPDLRGYGDSSRPPDGDRHINYSFRAMALDQIETMRYFGHEHFFVAAHDRGARVAHRLCLDFPKSVQKVCLLDVAPTLTMYRQTNQEFATKYMWWIQAAPLPEHLIGLDPDHFLDYMLGALNKTPGALAPEAVSEYRRCFCCTSTIHATCEEFRASADIGLEMDEADDRDGNKIVAPVLALWGARGTVGRLWDVVATWQEKASAKVEGHSLDCGHFLQEERPDETLQEIQQFFETA